MSAWLVIACLGAGCIAASFFIPATARAGSSRVVKEIEETMEQFAAEIDQENKELLASVAQMKKDHEQQVVRLTSKIDKLEKQSVDMSHELKLFIFNKLQTLDHAKEASAAQQVSAMPASPVSGNDVHADLPVENETIAESETESVDLRGRFAHIFNLYDEGKSIDTIARRLGLTKGEVSLIIQLAKQEEDSRG